MGKGHFPRSDFTVHGVNRAQVDEHTECGNSLDLFTQFDHWAPSTSGYHGHVV